MEPLGSGQRIQLNREIREIGEKIAEKVGIDQVYMTEPHFDFFSWGVWYVKQKYPMLKRNDPEARNVASEAIQVMVFNINTGAPGYLYDYAEHARKGEEFPFDVYFKTNFPQKASNVMKQRSGYGVNRTKKHVSILPGRAEKGGGGIPEQFLGVRTDSPSAGMEGEDYERWVNKTIPGLLSHERNGHILLEYYRLRREGKLLQEITDHLNHLAQTEGDKWYPKGGWKWHTGTVQRFEKLIKKIVHNYLQEQELEPEDIVSSREGRVVFQVRQN